MGEGWAQNLKLQEHLLDESDRMSIVLWGTGLECDWKIAFQEGVTDKEGVRNIVQYINNTSGELYLLNYDSLTMAAQYDDYPLPDDESKNYKIELPKGLLKIKIIQLVDPSVDGFWEELENQPGFLLEYEKVESGENKLPSIPWASI